MATGFYFICQFAWIGNTFLDSQAKYDLSGKKNCDHVLMPAVSEGLKVVAVTYTSGLWQLAYVMLPL